MASNTCLCLHLLGEHSLTYGGNLKCKKCNCRHYRHVKGKVYTSLGIFGDDAGN